MTISLLRHTLRSRRLAIIWFSVGTLFYSLLTMALWPFSSSLDLAAMFEQLPDSVRSAFFGPGIGGQSVMETTFFQYLAARYGTWLPLILGYFGIWLGAGIIAREYDRDSLDLLLAQPLTRIQLALAKYAGAIFASIPVVALSAIGLLIGVALWGDGMELSAGAISLMHVQALLFTAAAMAIGLLLASIFLEPGKSYGLAAGIMVIMYLGNLVAQFVDSISWLRYGSLFHYWQPVNELSSGKLDSGSALTMAAIAGVAMVAALAIFRRRDIST